jgi:hypothetical protein
MCLRKNTAPLLDPYGIHNDVRLAVRGTTPLLGSLAQASHQDGATFIFFRQPLQAASAPQAAPSDWTPARDFDLELGEHGVTIKKYKGTAETVNIPAVIDGSPVVTIGAWAFDGCTSLTSISIPSSVTAIGNWAFWGCNSLTSISVDALNTRYSAANGILFSKDGKTLVRYPEGKVYSSYTIPSSVTAIGYAAFSGCNSLSSISIPSSVTTIGNWAFSGCNSLTSISIPSSVTAIGYGAFYGCSSLTSISIPSGVTAIGDWAFNGCNSLTSISIPSDVTTIGNWAFSGCSSLSSISIPSSVTAIGDYAFAYCDGLSAESREVIRRRFGGRVF